MNNLLQLCSAFVLACVLTVSAHAGDMSAGVTAPPPPVQAETVSSEAAISFTDAVVTILQSVLGLL